MLFLFVVQSSLLELFVMISFHSTFNLLTVICIPKVRINNKMEVKAVWINRTVHVDSCKKGTQIISKIPAY